MNVSDDAKDLISQILKTDPKERIKLDQIMEHEFFQKPFPERMPVSTLSIPPSSEFLSKYPSMGVTVNKTSDMMGKSP